MADVADVVVVGGGIAGASLAFALAAEGLGVTVLEATTRYEDRVRGESMQAWGVHEARLLGVEQVLLAAGAHTSPLWKQYVDGAAAPAELPMMMMVPGVDGSLNLRHPDACQALLDAAAGAGATVVRGVRGVELSGGAPPSVSWAVDGETHMARTSLVVGADGRASTVRKQVGIELERQEPVGYIAGMLLDGLDEVPDDHDAMVAEGDRLFLLFHQGGARARAYLAGGLSSQHRFSGRGAARSFLEACDLSCFPWSEQVVAAAPAGPCATYPGDDTWTDVPYADGVVLIGDAAGHNDPIVGQGLSISLRDARIVRDVVLDAGCASARFESYAEERVARMERLRLVADVLAVTFAEDATNRPARLASFREGTGGPDPSLLPLMVGAFAGPETIPAELVDLGIPDRIRRA